MARAHHSDILVDAAGNIIIAAVGTLYTDAATSVLVDDNYTAASGGSLSSTVTTDSGGRWKVWFTEPKSYWIEWDNAGGTARYKSGALLGSFSQVSQEHQAFQSPADEAAEDAADETGGIGSWDEMQAITPADGAPWYATDQGVSYVGVDGVWTRTTGNAKDIWVTDYGWKCDNDTASASANVTAIRAAIDAARSTSPSSQFAGTRFVVIPEAPGFTTAYVNEPINFELVSLVGVGGTQKPQFALEPLVRVAYTGAGFGADAVFVLDASEPGVHGGHLDHLYVTGDNRALQVLNSGKVSWDHCFFLANTTALARNHAVVIDTTFWINGDHFQASMSGTPGDRYPIGLYCTDGGNIGHAIAEAYFDDVQLINGNIYLEHQNVITGGGTGENVCWSNVVSENGNNQALFTARNTGSVAIGLIGWQWENCQQADATFADANQPVFDLDGGGFDNYVGWKLKGLFQNRYLIKAVDVTSLTGWEIERLHDTQDLIHPDSDASVIYSLHGGGNAGAGLWVRSNVAATGLAAGSLWQDGVADVGFRVGHAMTDTHARGMWQAGGELSWGPGNAVVDTVLKRTGPQAMSLAGFAAEAATLTVANFAGNLSGTTVSGSTSVTGGFVSGTASLRVGATPATADSVRLPNNTGISWRNAANTANIQALLVTNGDITQLWGVGAGLSLLTNTSASIAFAPNSTTSFTATTTGLSMVTGKNIILATTGAGTMIGSGATQLLAFWGATPVVQPSALTQTYSTADATFSAYTADNESAAYTGIDNAQGGTVYATVADLNALRVAYENLRAFAEDHAAFTNSAVDKLQTIGILS